MELTIRNLSKTYPNGVRALRDVSLDIPRGMFGLLGPNGAGKSTLMRIIATLQEADSGEALLGEIDVLRQKEDVRRILGYLPQDFGVYPRISAQDMLDHLALLKGMADKRQRKEVVEAILHRANLYEHRKKALMSFSGGMRQRWGIAQALLGNPQLLIVDEPTAGLDPGERNRFYNLLSEILKEMIGEEAINRALRKLIGQFAYTQPPYPTSHHLVDALSEVTPPELQYLIRDLFEEITLFSKRTLSAQARKRPDGRFDITMEVESKKFKADEKGAEKEVALNDWIEIGAFARPARGKRYGATLYRQQVKITAPRNTYTFTVGELPEKAGIDPFSLLVDRVLGDNLKKVTL
ncbi:MAG: ATP-binding cassette domain-containing protein [Acidobacteria bacterium]|nr:ATP-binding cassette domain-containing protein [Acidobacteriota bacterium]